MPTCNSRPGTYFSVLLISIIVLQRLNANKFINLENCLDDDPSSGRIETAHLVIIPVRFLKKNVKAFTADVRQRRAIKPRTISKRVAWPRSASRSLSVRTRTPALQWVTAARRNRWMFHFLNYTPVPRLWSGLKVTVGKDVSQGHLSGDGQAVLSPQVPEIRDHIREGG